MPLVVPGLSSTGGNDKNSEWANKLMGKKLQDTSDNISTFAKKDLPEGHRIVRQGDALTMDHKPDRLNVHVADDGTVTHVTHG